MGPLYPCVHCNGTTFCSASRDATGKLKTRPACVCCVVKAGLNPKGIYDRVVCSVCGGRGLVEPARVAPKVKRPANLWALLVVLPALLVALLFFAFGAGSYYRQRRTDDDMADQLLEGNAAA